MTAELVPTNAAEPVLVRLAADLPVIEAAFRAYTQACDRLLTPEDFQTISGKQYRKKSAWRKLAVAFNVSCEYLDRDYERAEDGRIVRAEVVVRATAMNGRFMDGLGACDIKEKCCVPGCRRNHRHCEPGCDGSPHFSNPSHDIPATAATRATNRACADLFGMGEVSAEEIEEVYDVPAPPRNVKRVVSAGPPGVGDNVIHVDQDTGELIRPDEPRKRELIARVMPAVKTMDQDQRARFDQGRINAGLSLTKLIKDHTVAELEELDNLATEIMGEPF